MNIFLDHMVRYHCQHLAADIEHFVKSMAEEMVDKDALQKKMVDKWSIKPSLAEKLVDILEFVVDKGEFTTVTVSMSRKLLKVNPIHNYCEWD